MSGTAGSAIANSPVPWKSAFLEHVNTKMDFPEFVLSTIDAAPAGSPTPWIPRARYCVFRGFWAELPENKYNDAPKNERVFESEMPTFTTDIRMDKIPQIFGSSPGHAESKEQILGSGGGGPVEAVWWFKDVMTQWRMRGQAFVVGPDIEGEGEEGSGVRTVKSEVGKRMRIIQSDGKGQWSWQRELTGHFGNMSPAMRGSFKQPPPGQPKSKPFNDKELGIGIKVDDLDDPVSRKNFRVVVIRPDVVEQLDLSDPSSARRQVYTFSEDSGDWREEEKWP